MLTDVLQILPPRIAQAFAAIQETDRIREIHLRAGGKAFVNCGGKLLFVSPHGALSTCNGLPVFMEDISQIVYKACEYSVYSYEQDLAQGFLTIRGGHRIGLCGTAVCDGGRVCSVKDVTALNIRIAAELHGCADGIFSFCSQSRDNVLVLSRPAAGKTTILRELARRFSYAGRKVCIIDERGELGAVHNGTSPFDFGDFCDIFDKYPKAAGISAATRTMSPDVIVVDEIGGEDESAALLNCTRCGVQIIASAHAERLNDALRREYIKKLLVAGIFTRLIFLAGTPPGKVDSMIKVKDGKYETVCNPAGLYGSVGCRTIQSDGVKEAGIAAAGDSRFDCGISS